MPEFVLIISPANSWVSSLDANGVASDIPWFVSTAGGHIVTAGMLSVASSCAHIIADDIHHTLQTVLTVELVSGYLSGSQASPALTATVPM